MPAVTVSFGVNIDASNNLEVYGQSADVANNPIYPSETLSVNVLYDLSAVPVSIFEFKEPGSINDIVGRVRTVDKSALTGPFVRELQALLEGKFRCDEAVPYSTYVDPSGGAAAQQFSHAVNYEAENFGRVALGTYAKYLFGHPQATAAISNDTEFKRGMLSQNLTTGVWEHDTDADNVFIGALGVPFDVTPTGTSAKLATRLVKEILTANTATAIAKAVIGQDASRAMGHDNNEYDPDAYQYLKFEAGDKIILSITLTQPVIFVGGGQQVSDGDLLANHTSTQYDLVITLA